MESRSLLLGIVIGIVIFWAYIRFVAQKS